MDLKTGKKRDLEFELTREKKDLVESKKRLIEKYFNIKEVEQGKEVERDDPLHKFMKRMVLERQRKIRDEHIRLEQE